MNAYLALEDGTVFKGKSFGSEGNFMGEIVFNTGMTGYQEVLTDPSYCGQIVTMTYPLIGNYGINMEDVESARPQVKGFIVRKLCNNPSNWRSMDSLNNYLKQYNIVGIEGIDTRALTRILRDKGTMRGVLYQGESFNINEWLDKIKVYQITNPVLEVSTKVIEKYEANVEEDILQPLLRNNVNINGEHEVYNIAMIDLGIKKNIIRSLQKRNCNVTVYPAETSAKDILDTNPDGIMLSNGPGDPKDCTRTIETIKELMGKNPIFGICLGHQLTALANGADTEKLKYGHRGCNHPVKDIDKELTYITSQNHGYTIVPSSIDKNRMVISHINMNDNTVEGIRYLDMPLFTVQFHPEASPGPTDTAYLFDEFIELIRKEKESK